jgi:NADPH-dependent 2,4-dienoyl-CoA reductase/sulfur reductase-like enzyme
MLGSGRFETFDAVQGERNRMKSVKHVVLGGGMVAGYAAKEFVERGGSAGDLSILSADNALPYERPPLSKGVLTGKDSEDSVFISPEAFYKDHGIDVRLNTFVSGVDFASKRLILSGGEELVYEKLVIATGAQPRTLDIPGAGLDGVLYLRSLDDSRRIKQHGVSGKRALVVGGGFIAMEVASSLAQRGMKVTMAVREERIWKSFFTEEMSESFRRYYESHGVQLALHTNVVRLAGNGQVKSAELAAGKRIDCDIVVAGVGVTPVTEIFKGVVLGNGVHVNEFLESSDPDVFAAGDAANYYDVLFKKQRRVEHWDNAVSQGQHIARSLLGERKPFVHVPYFFSDIFDLSYEFWGDTTGAIRTVYRGDVNSTSFSAWWLDEANRVLAAFVMNRPDEERESAPRLIETKQTFVE